ncbi:MAG TPA: AbrB/MazE/SpoVT family DNA-binding domain-containing protein [Candidatus Kapabacteria bacterium]|jgi:bifunctional DNA-binding transcriptional regulator/antitoxin component of YhaV-PrlF toxin-antitoxin module|nr:AbrB/MazE/SpoVT family DNA-binding domain-containing protein [Candidatus Kapabacteria bacterium]
MDREFEGTIDSEGHLDLPREIRERHGLFSGAKVKIEEKGKKLVIEALPRSASRKNITDLAGFLGKESNALNILMEERRRDREAEDRSFRP